MFDPNNIIQSEETALHKSMINVKGEIEVLRTLNQKLILGYGFWRRSLKAARLMMTMMMTQQMLITSQIKTAQHR